MILIYFIVLFLLTKGAYCLNGCGDSSWKAFKDEKCYKLISTDLLTREDAENVCGNTRSEESNETSYVPTLAEVHSVEEQNVLENYLIGEINILENVWLRAQRRSGTTFYWNNQTDVKYANWATSSPSEESSKRNCIVMLSGQMVRNKQLFHNMNKIEKYYGKSSGSENDTLNTKIEENKLKEVHSSSNSETEAGHWKDVNCQLRNLVVCQKFQTWSVPKIQTTLMRMRTDLEFEISNKIPIGFIYIQIPTGRTPQDLWPNFVWADVSSDFAGLFFRVEGGNSASFGTNQGESCPRLRRVENHHVAYAHEIDIPTDGTVSYPVYGGSDTGNAYGMTFLVSADEIRPVNTAIRIWSRTA